MNAYAWALFGLDFFAATAGLAIVLYFLVTFNREVRRPQKIRQGLAAVAEFEAEHGAFTDAELAAARFRVAYQGRGRHRAG